ncbi:MAG: hypothetical protein AB1758_38555 [Candidatus Eremiobacterota bacterium]
MDLWTLTADRPTLDPDDLARAIERQLEEGQPDYRTRLLVREAALAPGCFWERRPGRNGCAARRNASGFATAWRVSSRRSGSPRC